MTTINTILSCYGDGKLTRPESVAAIARLITPDNVAEVMALLPEDWARDLEQWASRAAARDGVVVGANLSAEEAQRIAQDCRIASQAVKEWVARREKRASPAKHSA